MFVRPPDPREYNAAISGDLRTVLEVALEKDRDRRYPTAAEFADELRRVRENVPILARRAGPLRRLRGWVQRNPVVAASLALTFLTLVIGLVVSLKALGRAEAASASEAEKSEKLAMELELSEPMADLQQLNELATWSERLWPSIPEKVEGPDGMDAWLAHAGRLISRKPDHEAALKRFSDPADPSEPGKKHERVRVLAPLVSELTQLPAQVAAMQVRRQEAQSVQARTIDEPRSQWSTIAVELGKDPGFASISPIKPQLGLLPLGRNPEGCEEFAVFGSGAVPKRKEGSGELDVAEESAIVLVLLPGGTLKFWSRPPGGTSPNEKPEELETRVAPFFMGKYEVTQAQWFRMWKSNPSVAQRGSVAPPITPRHPVEWVPWARAGDFCLRFGLELPTQDQWEFAARARAGLDWGDCPEWLCLEGRENLADVSFKPINPEAPRVPWDDGYQMHAPVGSFRPNTFGLHDMLGNVSEWCSDRYRRTRGSGGEPLADEDDASESKPTERRKVIRGSNWQATGDRASCRWFGGMIADGAQPIVGFRVMRPVDR
jgi:formylglycine-generating enzyme required for sulfatase activity